MQTPCAGQVFNCCSFLSVLSPGGVALLACLSCIVPTPLLSLRPLFSFCLFSFLWRLVLCSAVMPHACPAETSPAWGSCRWNDWAQAPALQVGQLLPVGAWRNVAGGPLLLASQPDFLTGALKGATEAEGVELVVLSLGETAEAPLQTQVGFPTLHPPPHPGAYVNPSLLSPFPYLLLPLD